MNSGELDAWVASWINQEDGWIEDEQLGELWMDGQVSKGLVGWIARWIVDSQVYGWVGGFISHLDIVI